MEYDVLVYFLGLIVMRMRGAVRGQEAVGAERSVVGEVPEVAAVGPVFALLKAQGSNAAVV